MCVVVLWRAHVWDLVLEARSVALSTTAQEDHSVTHVWRWVVDLFYLFRFSEVSVIMTISRKNISIGALCTTLLIMINRSPLSQRHAVMPPLESLFTSCSVPLKVQIFLWMYWHEKIQMTYQLKRRNQDESKLCKCCGKDETVDHLIFSCPIAIVVWCCVRDNLGGGMSSHFQSGPTKISSWENMVVEIS